ncbi:MAG: hypothetical protein AB7E61_06120 [Acholeplasmataceae bacterium]
MRKFKSKNGKDVVLLNPSEKGSKYVRELKSGIAETNLGEVKLGKDGKPQKLTKRQRAFRSGYLQSRTDGAKAYKAKNKKK